VASFQIEPTLTVAGIFQHSAKTEEGRTLDSEYIYILHLK